MCVTSILQCRTTPKPQDVNVKNRYLSGMNGNVLSCEMSNVFSNLGSSKTSQGV